MGGRAEGVGGEKVVAGLPGVAIVDGAALMIGGGEEERERM